jgi:pimeloyl-ACP methyl ester carboxylesterase
MEARPVAPVYFRTVNVDGLDIFYREAGDPKNPTILLLHGFPSSSSQYCELIPLLSNKYHVVAPDYPGFGHSAQPSREAYHYTFDHLYETIDHFTKAVGVSHFVLYGHDYGAPVGLRFTLHQPERIRALIIQNGNAYEVGLSPLWAPIKALWASDRPETREAVAAFLNREGTKFEHGDGAPPDRVNPDAIDLDQLVLDRPGNRDIQLDLFADYKSNLALYPAFHEAFRKHQFPTLIVWGRNDSSFTTAGAEAYRDDLPKSKLYMLDAGHFACETHAGEIASLIREFLPAVLDGQPFRKRRGHQGRTPPPGTGQRRSIS